MKRFLLTLSILMLLCVAGMGFQKPDPPPPTQMNHLVTTADFQRIAGPALQNYQFAQQARELAESKEEIARRDYVDALNKLKIAAGVPTDKLDEFDLQQIKDKNGQIGLQFVRRVK